MILFFKSPSGTIVATETVSKPVEDDINKLCWLYGNATLVDIDTLNGYYVGPRREMITPWSTNAVEITQNMGLSGISRIEEFTESRSKQPEFDKMLQRVYHV